MQLHHSIQSTRASFETLLFERLASESLVESTLGHFSSQDSWDSSKFYQLAMHKIGHGGTHLTSWAQELHSVALVFWLTVARHTRVLYGFVGDPNVCTGSYKWI